MSLLDRTKLLSARVTLERALENPRTKEAIRHLAYTLETIAELGEPLLTHETRYQIREQLAAWSDERMARIFELLAGLEKL